MISLFLLILKSGKYTNVLNDNFQGHRIFLNKVGRSTPLNHFKTIYLEVR